MSIEIKGLDSLMKKLAELGGNVKKPVKVGMDVGLTKITNSAQINCPVDMGRLRQSIQYDLSENGDKIVGTVGTNVEYALYVEFGTGPVGQSNAPEAAIQNGIAYRTTAWAFPAPSNSVKFGWKEGERVFTRGQAAQPFLYPALKQHQQDVFDEIAYCLEYDIKRLSK